MNREKELRARLEAERERQANRAKSRKIAWERLHPPTERERRFLPDVPALTDEHGYAALLPDVPVVRDWWRHALSGWDKHVIGYPAARDYLTPSEAAEPDHQDGGRPALYEVGNRCLLVVAPRVDPEWVRA